MTEPSIREPYDLLEGIVKIFPCGLIISLSKEIYSLVRRELEWNARSERQRKDAVVFEVVGDIGS